jgi:hypothetical protein
MVSFESLVICASCAPTLKEHATMLIKVPMIILFNQFSNARAPFDGISCLNIIRAGPQADGEC